MKNLIFGLAIAATVMGCGEPEEEIISACVVVNTDDCNWCADLIETADYTITEFEADCATVGGSVQTGDLCGELGYSTADSGDGILDFWIADDCDTSTTTTTTTTTDTGYTTTTTDTGYTTTTTTDTADTGM